MHRKYGEQFSRTTSDTSGDQVITGVGGRIFFVLFSAWADADFRINCTGLADEADGFCDYNKSITLLSSLLGATGLATDSSKDPSACIRLQNGAGAGWSAAISAVGQDGFTLTWTKLGAGLNITFRYKAVV